MGTVCEATTYGRNPRCRAREWARSAPRTKPPTAPMAKPSAASRPVNAAALSSVTISRGPCAFGRSKSAREGRRGKVAEAGAAEEVGEAGNQWFTLGGTSGRALLIGGHIDSVPNGGWLDGSLNLVAGVEVLRRIAADGQPPLTVRLVNW